MALGLLNLITKVLTGPKAAELRPADLRVLDALKDVAEAEEMADAAAAPVAEGRTVISPAERKALADEDAQDRLASFEGPASAAAKIAALEAEKRAIDEKLVPLYAAAHDSNGYRERREARWAIQHAGRVGLVDILEQQCRDEADALWPPAATMFEEPAPGRPHWVPESYEGRMDDRTRWPVTITNEQSVVARQRGLRELADTVKAWGERGSYLDASNLQAKFDREHGGLPRVQSLRQVAERLAVADPWFSRFVGCFRADPNPLPPAA